MSEIKEPIAYFRLEQDAENNLGLDIKGKGGELAAMIASVMDDDPEIKKLFEFAFMMLEMKASGVDMEGDEASFMNPPVAEA